MGFLKKIYSSIYSPDFYREIPKSKLSSGFLYFFFFIVILTVFRAAPLVFTFFTTAQKEITNGIKESAQYYPQDLIVTIKNGKVSTNAQEPYAIANPGDVDEEHKNIVVIDTITPFSLEKFKEYKTFAWVTREALYITNRSEVRAYDLAEVKDFRIDRNKVQEIVNMISPWVPLITPLVAVALVVGLLLFYALRLVYLLFLALLILLLSRGMKWGFTYRESYKIGIYALTLPLILEIVLSFIPTLRIPFLTTIIALAVVVVNYVTNSRSLKK